MLALVSTLMLALLVLAVAAPPSSAQIELPPTTVEVPAVTLGQINVLSPSSVRISGTVDPAVAGTTAFVEYRGLDGVLKRAPVTLGVGLDRQNVSLDLKDLLPGSAYEARLVATNPLDPVLGQAAGQSSLTEFSAFRTQSSSSDSSSGASPRGVGGEAGGGGAPTRVNGTLCTKVGTARADRLRGTAKKDVICGLGGNDKIYGLSGNDVLIGGAGNDTLVGGKGRDRLLGGAGEDRINARDRLRDYVNGGSGSDRATVDVRKGKDTVRAVERGVRNARRARS